MRRDPAAERSAPSAPFCWAWSDSVATTVTEPCAVVATVCVSRCSPCGTGIASVAKSLVGVCSVATSSAGTVPCTCSGAGVRWLLCCGAAAAGAAGAGVSVTGDGEAGVAGTSAAGVCSSRVTPEPPATPAAPRPTVSASRAVLGAAGAGRRVPRVAGAAASRRWV